AERRSAGLELIADGLVIFLSVQRPVFADRKFQEQIEHATGGIVLLAVGVGRRGRQGLVLVANRVLRLLEQLLAVLGLNAGAGVGAGIRFPVEEIAAAIGAVVAGLMRPEDQAGKRIAGVADAGHVPPSVC